MHLVIIIALGLHLVDSRPQLDKNARTTWYENYNDGHGNFGYGYETSNGITNYQKLQQEPTNSKASSISMRGFFAFVAPDSTRHEVRYISDERGFHPSFSLSRQRKETDDLNNHLGRTDSNRTDELKKNDTIVTTYLPPGKTTHSIPVPETSTKGVDVPQAVVPVIPAGNVTEEASQNSTKQSSIPTEFPDRIGQPALISLQSPPG